MAYPTGQVLSAPITNGSPNAQFGTHIDYLGTGGYRSVATLADRDAIPTKSAIEYDGLGSGMRRHLMLVAVQETGLIYVLYKSGFQLMGNDASKLAALRDNTNWLFLTDFLNVQSTSPNELSADQLAAVQAAATPSATNRFLTATDLASIAFPTGTTTPTTLYVQGFGQTTPGVPGNPLRPYNTVQAAVDAAKANDTIIILPGGDSTDYLGRRAYSQSVSIAKNLSIIFLGGIASGYWGFGTYPGATYEMTVTVSGGVWTNGLAIVASNGQNHRYSFDNCSFEDKTSIYELVPSWIDQTQASPGLDIQTYTNCRFSCTNAIGVDGPLKLQGRDDEPNGNHSQNIHIILQDCQLSSVNTPIVTGYASAYTLIYLRGSTNLKNNANQYIQSVTRVNQSNIIDDAEILVDERISSVSSQSIIIKELVEYKATSDGLQSIVLPVNTAGVLDIKVLEVSGSCRGVYQKHYTMVDNVLTLGNNAAIIAGDKISGSYYVLTGSESVKPPIEKILLLDVLSE